MSFFHHPPDRIVLDGREGHLLPTEVDPLRSHAASQDLAARDGGDWRGHHSRWQVVDGVLRLERIFGWVPGHGDLATALLSGTSLPIEARWVTGTLPVGFGHRGEGHYAAGVLLEVAGGIVTDTTELPDEHTLAARMPLIAPPPLLDDPPVSNGIALPTPAVQADEIGIPEWERAAIAAVDRTLLAAVDLILSNEAVHTQQATAHRLAKAERRKAKVQAKAKKQVAKAAGTTPAGPSPPIPPKPVRVDHAEPQVVATDARAIIAALEQIADRGFTLDGLDDPRRVTVRLYDWAWSAIETLRDLDNRGYLGKTSAFLPHAVRGKVMNFAEWQLWDAERAVYGARKGRYFESPYEAPADQDTTYPGPTVTIWTNILGTQAGPNDFLWVAASLVAKAIYVRNRGDVFERDGRFSRYARRHVNGVFAPVTVVEVLDDIGAKLPGLNQALYHLPALTLARPQRHHLVAARGPAGGLTLTAGDDGTKTRWGETIDGFDLPVPAAVAGLFQSREQQEVAGNAPVQPLPYREAITELRRALGPAYRIEDRSDSPEVHN